MKSARQPNKLAIYAAKHYIDDLEVFIPKLIEEKGSVVAAARVVEVTPGALHTWLKNRGLGLKIKVTREVKVVPLVAN